MRPSNVRLTNNTMVLKTRLDWLVWSSTDHGFGSIRWIGLEGGWIGIELDGPTKFVFLFFILYFYFFTTSKWLRFDNYKIIFPSPPPFLANSPIMAAPTAPLGQPCCYHAYRVGHAIPALLLQCLSGTPPFPLCAYVHPRPSIFIF